MFFLLWLEREAHVHLDLGFVAFDALFSSSWYPVENCFFQSALHLLLRRLAFQKFPEVKIGSSLQPQRIPATFAGLVEVKLCVGSFMTIHRCSSL